MKITTAAILACVTVPAFGSISRTTIPTPGGFVQAGVSPIGQGFFSIVGDDFEPLYNDPGDDFSEGSFAGIGPVLRSASASTADSNGNSTAQAGMGYMDLAATNVAPNASFGNAGAHGGFKENFLVTGGTPGAQAWMLVDVSIAASMNAAGFAGRAFLNIGAFKNDIELRSNEPFWDNGNSDSISTDRQRASWGLATFAAGENTARTVDDMITFSVPITLGTPFNLGIYAFADAGKRSSGGAPGSSSATINSGVTWVQARVVDAAGTTIMGTNISGETGLNWPGGPTACPADLAAPFGVLDFFDVSAFITAYSAQDPAADFAAPFGSFDFFDVSAFITAYTAGCP